MSKLRQTDDACLLPLLDRFFWWRCDTVTIDTDLLPENVNKNKNVLIAIFHTPSCDKQKLMNTRIT